MAQPWRATTNATVISSPAPSREPTTAASSTSGCSISTASTSAGDTQIPPALIMSLLRPRNVQNPSAERVYTSPVASHSPWNAARVAASRLQ